MLGFFRSTLGKKVIVALTGMVLFAFVVAHMIGNLKMFLGPGSDGTAALDHYAEFLRSAGEVLFGRGGLLWLVRIVLLAAAVLHVCVTIQLWRLNRAARPEPYAGRRVYLMSTFASRTMLWGGLLIAAFIVLHILHFTTGDLHLQGFVEGMVYANVYRAFSVPYVSAAYTAAMIPVGLHIYHGAWSMFQTLGLDDPSRNRGLRLFAAAMALIVFLGFIAVPIAVLTKSVPAPFTTLERSPYAA